MYLGRDDESGQEAAIIAVHELNRQHFEVMAQVTARLDHPSIPRFIGCERHDRAVFALIEHSEGRTLTDALGSGVSIGWALRILAEVLDVLSCAHAAGILHGDIKPHSILAQNHGRTWAAARKDVSSAVGRPVS